MDKYLGLILVLVLFYAAFASATITYLSKTPTAIYYSSSN